MVVDTVAGLETSMETLLFSLGGGGLLGYLAARALRVIVRIAAIIIGAFVLALAYLSYKGWITANWPIIQDQTQKFAYNASAQVLHMVNDTAFKFYLQQHPTLVSATATAAAGTPIAADVGFLSGFFLGIKR